MYLYRVQVDDVDNLIGKNELNGGYFSYEILY